MRAGMLSPQEAARTMVAFQEYLSVEEANLQPYQEPPPPYGQHVTLPRRPNIESRTNDLCFKDGRDHIRTFLTGLFASAPVNFYSALMRSVQELEVPSALILELFLQQRLEGWGQDADEDESNEDVDEESDELEPVMTLRDVISSDGHYVGIQVIVPTRDPRGD